MERRHRIVVLGRRQGAPMGADDPTRRRYGRCHHTGQEAESPSEGSLTEGGADRGGR